MAQGINRVYLVGHLGTEPELRATAGGQSVCKFRLATTERYTDKSNTPQERTEWHTIVVWGRFGETIARMAAKGDLAFVEGSLRTSSYERDGVKRERTEISATHVTLGNARKATGDEAASSASGKEPQRAARQTTPSYNDEEIPF